MFHKESICLILVFTVLVIMPLAISIVGCGILWRKHRKIQQSPLNVQSLVSGNVWLADAIEQLCQSITQEEYRQLGKPVFTQKGGYRANYLQDVNRNKDLVLPLFYTKGKPSDALCAYIESEHSEAKVGDLPNIVKSFYRNQSRVQRAKFNSFLSNCGQLTPDEFFAMRPNQEGDVVGVYVLKNQTKSKYYVGQAKKVFFRVNQHFTGHGNGDVYADYKYGDSFLIKIVKLSSSGYSDLDALERDLIKKYNAYSAGYNKTSGNR